MCIRDRADYILHLLRAAFRLCGGKVNFIHNRNELQIMIQREIGIRPVSYTHLKENAGTYTGLSPLPCVPFEVTDPENSVGLSTKGLGYGFGVAKDGKPQDISINNQKLFDKYHALALDTKSTQKGSL